MPENPVGLAVASSLAPEQVGEVAALAENLGFGELWIPEDYWYLGSIACLVRALSATETIPVGVGVMSALVRHPAVAAMEIAAAERMFPGRVRPGIGLGVPEIVSKMGIKPRSSLGAVRESVAILRTLLSGKAYTEPAGQFEADNIQLTHPPHSVPPIHLGVLGEKMLQLSGEIAEGTVVSAMASPAYLRWLRARIAEGEARRTTKPTRQHRVPAFAMYCVDSDTAAARAVVRPLVSLYLSFLSRSPLVTVNPFGPEVQELCDRGGAELIGKEMPDAWLDELTVAGDPATCAERIGALLDAGADSVVLMPVRTDDLETTLRRTADEVLPLVRSGA
ncbi:LLM class flavin-dependent oxidoreductase [Amycolatopsis jejuensis]|uniref:LLM class flavin-dependent oxidoreductase n=1 Tax=Amycolatopsis jejuensis TaxID=330084 RepID=UPI000525870A|nr:LLM class flavin-dependent oxidoreductase [Amycolatopsis jejuensis]